MTITIKLKTDNAAFEYREQEVLRILKEWISGEDGDPVLAFHHLRDINGNTVGTVEVRGK